MRAAAATTAPQNPIQSQSAAVRLGLSVSCVTVAAGLWGLYYMSKIIKHHFRVPRPSECILLASRLWLVGSILAYLQPNSSFEVRLCRSRKLSLFVCLACTVLGRQAAWCHALLECIACVGCIVALFKGDLPIPTTLSSRGICFQPSSAAICLSIPLCLAVAYSTLRRTRPELSVGSSRCLSNLRVASESPLARKDSMYHELDH
ncbi:hypothetical protein EXIGLDRAFT_725811 [Exidia glandulosa HHB12029]|uniref:Uncharacterized protein n=1 Tax=Exidia glandulosa HHB12029 TaxID=1314781 RepID=A0A165QBL1_EXIGL|nr:hypothetical protein EXIGLDRAFT_725811 [Exidia glandulosa HHB12029]